MLSPLLVDLLVWSSIWMSLPPVSLHYKQKDNYGQYEFQNALKLTRFLLPYHSSFFSHHVEATAASRAASSLQSTLCTTYASDPCLTGRSDYQQVCIDESAAPPSGSSVTSSLSLLTLALIVLCATVLSQLGTVYHWLTHPLAIVWQ